MADTTERRRSSRVHTTVLSHPIQDNSSDISQSDEDVDSSDSEVVKGGRVVSAKRVRNKSPAKRAAKRVKRKPIVNASIEVEDDPDRVENFLYEAILDDETSIDTLVTDFLESFEEDETEALKDLVNFVLRCCGTLQEITSYDVEDADTIPETLTQLQDHFTGKDQDVVKVSADTYPLVSKARNFKGFRKQLAEFWTIMVTHAADKQILYNEEGKLFNTIEAWLVSMSSSTLRSFRHTATTICLTIMTSLVELSAKLAKELESANKQLNVESKKSKKGTPKIKTIQKLIDSKKAQNDKVAELISNYFDAVFVHRYRDVDARIRAESVKELGIWMMKLPGTFFDGQYLRYLGWVLSDTSAPTRLEVIKALTKLYGYDEYAGGLRHFTERFKPRMIEIATEDAETNIRCAALGLVEKIRQRGYFEDEDTETILGCIFDREERVRHAVSETFQRVLQERESEIIDERLEGEVDDHGELKAKWVSLRALVGTFYSITKAHDKALAEDASELNIAREQSALCPGRVRIASASVIGALSDVDFETIAAYLLYDNDATHEPASAKPEDMLKSVLSMTPTEEHYLLELLVAAAEHGEHNAESAKPGKKSEGNTKTSEAIIAALPNLMARFKDAQQICTLLQLLTVCDLSVYSTLRKMKQFDALLGSLSRVFFDYQSEVLLRDIGYTLLFLSQSDTLNAAVKDKLLDMQEILRKDVLNECADESDVTLVLKRLEIISSVDDCVLSFDDDTGSNSIYEKLKELAVSDSATIKSFARKCLRNYFMWKVKQVVDTKFGLDLEDVNKLIAQRDDVLYVLDAAVEEGDAEAAMIVVDLEKIFLALNEIDSFDSSSVRKALDLNLQSLLVKVFQKEVKKYGRLQNRQVTLDSDISSDEEEDESDVDEDDKVSVLIDAERKMCTLAGEMVATIAAGKLDNQHIDVLLANKGKLGHSYDAILKELPNDMIATRKAATAKTKAMPKSRKSAQGVDSDALMAVEDDDIED